MNAEQPLAGYNGKPELSDGYTMIANELLDAIITHEFSKRQLKVLLLIMRKTYGFNKLEDDIARSQIVAITGIKNPHITSTMQELLEKNVIIISNGNYAKRYRINKYYDTWRVTKTVNVTETVTITETVINSYQNGNNPLPKQYPQKTTTKDNTKDMSELVLKTLNEKAKKQYKPTKTNLAFITSRLKEGFTIEDCFRVIDNKVAQWLNDDKFNQYLRPSTLFNAEKFSQYSGESPMQKRKGAIVW